MFYDLTFLPGPVPVDPQVICHAVAEALDQPSSQLQGHINPISHGAAIDDGIASVEQSPETHPPVCRIYATADELAGIDIDEVKASLVEEISQVLPVAPGNVQVLVVETR